MKSKKRCPPNKLVNSFAKVCLVLTLTVLPISVVAEPQCETKADYENARQSLENLERERRTNFPASEGFEISREEMERELKSADEYQRRLTDWEKRFKSAESALSDFESDLLKGKKMFSLAREIDILSTKIKTAEDAMNKTSKEERRKTIEYRQTNIDAARREIERMIPGSSVDWDNDQAYKIRDTLNDPGSNALFDSININMLRDEIERNEKVVSKMEEKFQRAAMDPGDDAQAEAAKREIRNLKPQLDQAIVARRAEANAKLTALVKNEIELDKMMAKLYPDQKVREAVINLQKNRDLKAQKEPDFNRLMGERASLIKEQNAAEISLSVARQTLSVNVDPVLVNKYRKKIEEMDSWEKKYEDPNSEYSRKVRKAEQLVNDLKSDYERIEAEKNELLAKHMKSASLKTVDEKLAAMEPDLKREARDSFSKSPLYEQYKAKKIELQLSFKNATKKSERDRIQQEWITNKRTGNAGLKKEFRRKLRVEELVEAKRLQDIANGEKLRRFNCFEDVAIFIQDLNLKASELRREKGSLVSDIPTQAKPVDIDLDDAEELGPLTEEPGDDVPIDIIEETGEVKVTQYFVLLLSTGGLYVGTEDSLKGRGSCNFSGGGRDCSIPIKWSQQAGPFASQAEAQAELCRSITKTKYFPLGIGLKGEWGGSDKWYGLWEASVRNCPKK